MRSLLELRSQTVCTSVCVCIYIYVRVCVCLAAAFRTEQTDRKHAPSPSPRSCCSGSWLLLLVRFAMPGGGPGDDEGVGADAAAIAAAVGMATLARYVVVKHSWRGKYERILCIGDRGVYTIHPNSLAVTNVYEFGKYLGGFSISANNSGSGGDAMFELLVRHRFGLVWFGLILDQGGRDERMQHRLWTAMTIAPGSLGRKGQVQADTLLDDASASVRVIVRPFAGFETISSGGD